MIRVKTKIYFRPNHPGDPGAPVECKEHTSLDSARVNTGLHSCGVCDGAVLEMDGDAGSPGLDIRVRNGHVRYGCRKLMRE